MSQEPTSPKQVFRKAYEESEKQWSKATEQLVASRGFAEGLAMFTSNAVAMSRVATTGMDSLVRAARIAGRGDITRLGRQLNRTEDKLEQVLQAVENLEEELVQTRAERDELRRAAADKSDTPKAGGEGQ